MNDISLIRPRSLSCAGVLYVADELDYEMTQQYALTLRATDSVTAVFAEVLVSILVTDVNDCPPEFPSDSYNVSVSEASPFGSLVLKVAATDNDTGIPSFIFKFKIAI